MNGRSDGLAPGHYRVVVSATEKPTPTNSEGIEPLDVLVGSSLIPSKYNALATSGLEFDVVAGEENVFEIDLVGPLDNEVAAP